jgi:hypothetical protein
MTESSTGLTRAELSLRLEPQEIFVTEGFAKYIFLRFSGIGIDRVTRGKKKMSASPIEVPYGEIFWPSLVFVESTLHTYEEELRVFCRKSVTKDRLMQTVGELIQLMTSPHHRLSIYSTTT